LGVEAKPPARALETDYETPPITDGGRGHGGPLAGLGVTAPSSSRVTVASYSRCFSGATAAERSRSLACHGHLPVVGHQVTRSRSKLDPPTLQVGNRNHLYSPVNIYARISVSGRVIIRLNILNPHAGIRRPDPDSLVPIGATSKAVCVRTRLVLTLTPYCCSSAGLYCSRNVAVGCAARMQAVCALEVDPLQAAMSGGCRW